MISVYVTAHSTHFAYTIWAVRFSDLHIDDARHFPTIFLIDENMFFSMLNHDYPIREEHHKLAILVMLW